VGGTSPAATELCLRVCTISVKQTLCSTAAPASRPPCQAHQHPLPTVKQDVLRLHPFATADMQLALEAELI